MVIGTYNMKMLVKIVIISACLPALNTLQMSHNRLTDAPSLEELIGCDYLSVLDLSHNKIDDPEVMDVFEKMKNLVIVKI